MLPSTAAPAGDATLSWARFCSQGDGEDRIYPAAMQTCTFYCSVNLPGFPLSHRCPEVALCPAAQPAYVQPGPASQGITPVRETSCSVGWAITTRKDRNACCCKASDKLPGWSFPKGQAAPSLFISQEQLGLAAVRDE